MCDSEPSVYQWNDQQIRFETHLIAAGQYAVRYRKRAIKTTSDTYDERKNAGK